MLLYLCAHHVDAQNVTKAEPGQENIGIRLADEQLHAYNNRDIEAFLKPYSDDVEVYTFPDKLQYKGKEMMRNLYGKMFSETPDLHCTIKSRVVHNNYVIDEEEVIKNGTSIHAVAIYLIEDNKIAKVYFLPR
ncbi:MAG TPA: nuclear transport factor 2 family protein [Cyclobacteriaceae bacterium]|nr:nuclear transport factor 2 family protein [Cyclobacteriaceae bacterium]